MGKASADLGFPIAKHSWPVDLTGFQ